MIFETSKSSTEAEGLPLWLFVYPRLQYYNQGCRNCRTDHRDYNRDLMKERAAV